MCGAREVVKIFLYGTAALLYTEDKSQFRDGSYVMRKLVVILFLSVASSVSAESRFGPDLWKSYLEFDQMLVMKFGAERSLSRHWGIKGGGGISVFGLTTVGYELVGVYHVMPPKNRFQWDIEFGLPLAYFNVLEGTLVDWDPHIDDPFAGWAPGASLVWGLRFDGGSILCIKTGLLTLFEYQRDSGWREGIPVIPEVAIQWMF